MLSLFKMIELSSGSITIDNKDISTISNQDVRIKLNALPQEPYFLNGTVRLNMDPYESSADDAMVQALTKVGLWTDLEARGGLDAELDSEALSYGQRQLFCLARSIIRDTKIVVLDEATSRFVRPLF
jgi:ATP-binding cassette subfamily C (CFTR/MRP) protein 1